MNREWRKKPPIGMETVAKRLRSWTFYPCVMPSIQK